MGGIVVKKNIEELKAMAVQIRRDIIEMLTEAGSGHPGGSLSAVEILTALYFNKMNIDPSKHRDSNRDRFVLSKGHAAPVLYSTLARRGYFDPAELKTLRKLGSILQGHPSMSLVPGVDMSTGSLGQGISAAVGMALAGKIDKKSYRVYTVLGDGELEEGEVWEATMAAAHYKLDNLVALIDNNGLQIDGFNKEVMNVDPIPDKFRAFNWNVIEVDGHSFEELLGALDEAEKVEGKPTAIVCKTIKGKCVSFMENECSWHGSAPNKEQCAIALKEIGGEI